MRQCCCDDGGNGGNGSGCVLLWGANLIFATTAARYLYPGYADANAGTSRIAYAMPRAGTLKNIYIYQNVPAGNGGLITYTIRKNGVDTALTVNTLSTSSSNSNNSDEVAFAQGDLVDLRVTKPVSIGTSPQDIVASLEFFV